MILKDWAIVYRTSNPYQAPELGARCAHGSVYGHPAYEDGTPVTTSKITQVYSSDIPTNVFIKTCSGSTYELGEPAAEYEECFPNAKHRLSLEEL